MTTWMEAFKANMAGNKAYRTHAQANRLSDTGRAAEAETLYKTAMAGYIEAEKLGCEKPNIMTGYSVLLMRNGNYQKAKDLLVKISEDKSLTSEDKFHLRVNFSICLWRMGELDKAMDSMRQSMSFAKTTSVYTTMCAMLNEKARQTADFTEAEALCKEALEYDDEDAAILDNMGRMLLYKSEKAENGGSLRAEAKKYTESSVRRNPNFASALYSLALMAHADGDDKTARVHIEQALSNRFPTTSPITREQAEKLQKEIG